MVTDYERQAILDQEHLRLLPIAYWVLGGFDIFIALYGLIYIAYGAFFALIPWEDMEPGAEAFPMLFGWFFAAFGLAFILFFGASAAFKIMTGFWLKGRRRRTAIYVSAAASCLWMPFGTVVGILTFIVLGRPSVAALFGVPPRVSPEPAYAPQPAPAPLAPPAEAPPAPPAG